MSEAVTIPVFALNQSNDRLGIEDLGEEFLKSVDKLQAESTGLSETIQSGVKVDGPGRNGDLSMSDMMHSFERSTDVSIVLHKNLTQFSVLSTTLTSFGNNLNSFLRGQ